LDFLVGVYSERFSSQAKRVFYALLVSAAGGATIYKLTVKRQRRDDAFSFEYNHNKLQLKKPTRKANPSFENEFTLESQPNLI
jgi:hypothetical protein